VTVASAARINSDAGTLTLSGGVTAADFGLTFGGAGNVTIDTTGLSLGTGSLTKDGAGLLLLSLANTFSGGTTVSAGTLKIGATGSLGSGAVSVASGATLDLNNLTIGNAITLADGATLTGGSLPTTSVPTSGVIDVVLTGTAPLEKTDTGRLELTGENTFTGATSVSAGTIAVADFGNGSTASPLGVTDLADPSKLILAGASGVIPVLEFTGSTGATTARSFTVGGDGAGIAAGSGAGALVFTSDAKINLTSADAEFRLVANNTAVNRFEATLATGSPGLKDVVIDGTGQWVIAGPANRFAGDFRLDVAGGTLKFESGALGDSSYVGSQIEVSNGAKLVWSGTNTDDISARLAIPVGATAQLDLGSNNVTFAGSPSVGGGATIQKQGAGTLTFSSAVNAPNLDVSLSSGTLVVNGSLGDVTVGSGAILGGAGTVGNVTAGSGAIIAPGNSPDTLFGISMYLGGGSIFQWEVYKPSLGAGVGYDNIELTGALDLSGAAANNKITLKVISLNASNLQGGVPDSFSKDNIYSFNFATVGSVVFPTGVTSANINDIFSIDVSQFQYSEGTASNSGLWSLSYDDAGTMTLTAVPEPSTYGFALGALALAAAAVRRRRKQAPKA
jgi:MYXO-CTERM domain-containing protein